LTMPSKESIWPVNRGLLWKEWRINRLYFLIAFLLMSYDLIIKTVGYGLKGILVADTAANGAAAWFGNTASNMLAVSYHNSLEQTGIYVSLLLGVIILMQERSGSLNYLVTTPVTRQEIIIAKFVAGSTFLLGLMFINAAFMAVASLLFGVSISAILIIKWAVLTTAAFIALFSLGLLVATFTGHYLSGVVLAFLVAGFPQILSAMLVNDNTQKIFGLSPDWAEKIEGFISLFVLSDYITRNQDAGTILQRFPPNYLTETLFLILITALLLLAAVRIFSRNPLENQGQMFIFDNAYHYAQILVAAIIAVGHAQSKASTIAEFAASMVIGFIIAYLVITLTGSLVYYLRERARG
jgi:ABC-type transport system involved in multi-copper enzyme maturation permease subunit